MVIIIIIIIIIIIGTVIIITHLQLISKVVVHILHI